MQDLSSSEFWLKCSDVGSNCGESNKLSPNMMDVVDSSDGENLDIY